MSAATPPLFVCYVPGLDRRRLDPGTSPYVCRLLEERPSSRIRTLPDTELLPTMLTGTWPHEHGVWQVRLRDEVPPGPPLVDRLPDLLTTTAQGVYHLLTGRMDLATLPPARRRAFDLRRFKYERRDVSWVEPSARRPSLFSLPGAGRSRYDFTVDFDALETLPDELVDPHVRLGFFELYAFDLAAHWNLDRPALMADLRRRVDDAVRALHAACERAGVQFILLCDHGQEPVTGTLDLRSALRELGLPEGEVTHYLQVPSARFWFRTDRAREAVRERLEDLPGLTLYGWRDLASLGLRFEDPAFGELYAFAPAGTVFFPHDFYQPVANLFLGLRDEKQRPRVRNPVHRGCHGYLPHHPSEEGYLVHAGAEPRALRPEMELVDVAPTLLELLGAPVPEHVSGCSALEPS